MASKSLKTFADSVVTRSGAMTGVSEDGKLVKIDPITIVTLLTTIIPQVIAWVKKCRGLKNDEVQSYVAKQQQDPRTQASQEAKLKDRIAKICRQGMRDEQRRAKATGMPADVDRYSLDSATIDRIAHNAIGEFVSTQPAVAQALVAEASTGV
jgi:hypothetical protein